MNMAGIRCYAAVCLRSLKSRFGTVRVPSMSKTTPFSGGRAMLLIMRSEVGRRANEIGVQRADNTESIDGVARRTAGTRKCHGSKSRNCVGSLGQFSDKNYSSVNTNDFFFARHGQPPTVWHEEDRPPATRRVQGWLAVVVSSTGLHGRSYLGPRSVLKCLRMFSLQNGGTL